MIGNNDIYLCIAEAKRLLTIALKQEQFVKGDFEITDLNLLEISKQLKITVRAVEKATP